MSKGVSLEWSIFGIVNPLRRETPLVDQQFSDRYILVTERTTVKIRRGIVRYKVLLDRTEDIDTFNIEQFPNNPNDDPLRSFLSLHNLGSRYAGGIVLQKQRKLYRQDNEVRVYHTEFTYEGQRDTNLTIIGRTKESILEAKARLGLSGSNLNFGEYLTKYVGSTQ